VKDQKKMRSKQEKSKKKNREKLRTGLGAKKKRENQAYETIEVWGTRS